MSEQEFRPVGSATPVVEGTIGAAAAAAVGAASAIRRKRVFHPDGVAYHAMFRATGGAYGAPLLDRPGDHPAVLRLSRGAGLPERLPDVLGLAVRIPDAHGPGEHQDLLLVSSWSPPVLRHALVPAYGFTHSMYSSVVPYRLGGRNVLFGARRIDDDATSEARVSDLRNGAPPPRFALELADVRGRWTPVGVLEPGARLSESQSKALRFDPSHSGGGIDPVGMVQALRRRAYRSSQIARPTT